MDPVTIALLIGLGTLIVERAFSWGQKIRKSKCCGNEIEFAEVVVEKPPTPPR